MEVEMDVAAIHHNNHHHHHHHQHHQHHQQQTLESMLHVCTKSQEDKKPPPPPPPEQPLKCPRCDSSNTKFCYYNNYSLTQPRYFCKACRRYWTKGGTLRNVPVGGGCRKSNKRNSSSSSSANSCSASLKMRGPQQLQPNFTSASNSNHLLAGLPYDSSTCSDLSLAFARLQRQQQNIGSNIGNLYDHFDQIDHHLGSSNNIGDQLGFINNNNSNSNNNSNTTNLWYNGGGNNIGNGDHLINPMFHDHQEQELKQELACNMMRPAEVGLMGFPWNMVESGNMVHEVESGRSMIGGYWNGIGATNWHGLLNSPLM